MITKTVYGYDSETKKFTNTLILDKTDRSPVTKSWNIPAGYTEIVVLEPRDGFDIAFDITNNQWQYVAIPEPESEPEPTLEEVKANKINELKSERDIREVDVIEYNNNLFDYDDKARDRLAIARQSLEDNDSTQTIMWTTADNKRVAMGVNDFKAINTLAAIRSNALHIRYNELKALVNAAETKEEVEAITWQ